MKQMKQELTQEYLLSKFDYNPDTGILNTKVYFDKRGRKWGGVESGYIDNDGYISIGLFNKNHKSHRLIWCMIYGYFPKEIDHINNIRNDNRLCNLRLANRSENNQNKIKCLSNNLAGFLGVSFDVNRKKYFARIKINGKQKHLGYANNPQDAHNLYIKAKRQLHPFGMI
jgi:hypothetical protein